MHNQFLQKIGSIRKEIEALDSRIEHLANDQEFTAVTAKQSKLKVELKRLYVEINSWEKSIDNPQKAVTKVLSQKPLLVPHLMKHPEQELNKQIVPGQISKPVIEQKLAIQAAKEVVQNDKPKIEPLIAQKKSANKDDFHSKAAQEAENQTKYLSSISKTSRNYGKA